MDGEKARKPVFRVSIRSLVLVIAAFAVSIVSVARGLRPSRTGRPAPIAVEKAPAVAAPTPSKLKALRDEAIKRAANRDPREEAERSRQLAEEIADLSRIQERIQEDLYRIRARSTKPPPPPTLDALRDPRNRDRDLKTEPAAGSP